MADDNDYATMTYARTRFNTLWDRINQIENRIESRLTALESHRCNCSAASSAGAATGISLSSSPDPFSEASSCSRGTSAVFSDPVSAAIRDDPKRPAWLTDEMLPLPEGTERVYHDPGAGGLWAYPGKYVWELHREGKWAKSIIDESSCVENGDKVYHVPRPAPVAKAKPAGETAWTRYVKNSADSPDYMWNHQEVEAFNAWFASEVAAAKAKPHAETAEEVAYKTMLDHGFRPESYPMERAMILAAIKRERGEA